LLQVCKFGVLKIHLNPVFLGISQFLLFEGLLIVNSVKIATFLFRKATKIVVCYVALLTTIKVLENYVQLIYLELESHVVEALLELVETDTIVEVDIEVSVGFGHSFESVGYLDPYQI